MQIVVINASPVVGSSTEILLREAGRAIAESLTQYSCELSLQTYRLNDYHQAIPCQSCGKAPTDEWCFYHDGLTAVLDAIATADAILFGSPIHFDAVSAQGKLLIDRCNCFRPADFADKNPNYRFLKRIPHKRPGGMIFVGGPEAWFEGARRCTAGWFKWIEIENLGTITFQSADFNATGLVSQDAGKLAEAHQLGGLIAAQLRERENKREGSQK